MRKIKKMIVRESFRSIQKTMEPVMWGILGKDRDQSLEIRLFGNCDVIANGKFMWSGWKRDGDQTSHTSMIMQTKKKIN